MKLRCLLSIFMTVACSLNVSLQATHSAAALLQTLLPLSTNSTLNQEEHKSNYKKVGVTIFATGEFAAAGVLYYSVKPAINACVQEGIVSGLRDSIVNGWAAKAIFGVIGLVYFGIELKNELLSNNAPSENEK